MIGTGLNWPGLTDGFASATAVDGDSHSQATWSSWKFERSIWSSAEYFVLSGPLPKAGHSTIVPAS